MVVTYSWFVGEDFCCAAPLVEGVVGIAVDIALAHEVFSRLGVEAWTAGVAVKVLACPADDER